MCCSACHPGQKHALYSNEFNILIFSSATILFLPSSEIWLIPRGISLIAWQNPLFPGFSIGVHQKTGNSGGLQEVADAEKGSFEVTALHQWGSVWMWSKRFCWSTKNRDVTLKTSGCVQNWGILPSLSDLTIKNCIVSGSKFWGCHKLMPCVTVAAPGRPSISTGSRCGIDICSRRPTPTGEGLGVNNPRKGSNWVTRMYSYV